MSLIVAPPQPPPLSPYQTYTTWPGGVDPTTALFRTDNQFAPFASTTGGKRRSLYTPYKQYPVRYPPRYTAHRPRAYPKRRSTYARPRPAYAKPRYTAARPRYTYAKRRQTHVKPRPVYANRRYTPARPSYAYANRRYTPARPLYSAKKQSPSKKPGGWFW